MLESLNWPKSAELAKTRDTAQSAWKAVAEFHPLIVLNGDPDGSLLPLTVTFDSDFTRLESRLTRGNRYELVHTLAGARPFSPIGFPRRLNSPIRRLRA